MVRKSAIKNNSRPAPRAPPRPDGAAAAAGNQPPAARTGERRHPQPFLPGRVREVCQPAAVGRECRQNGDEWRRQERLCPSQPEMAGVALDRRRPDLHSAAGGGLVHRQPLAVRRNGLRHLPGLAVRQPLRHTRAVGADPIDARRCRIRGPEHQVLAVWCPHRPLVLAWQKSNARCGVAIEILHPDVFVVVTVADRKCQALAVGRESRIAIEPRSRVQRPRSAGAVQPEDRPLKFPVSAAVDEDSGLGKAEIPARVLPVVDVFDYRLRISGERQPASLIRSPSFPPLARNVCAKVCRNWWG